MFSKIVSSGSYLPEKVVNNDQLSQLFTTSDEWIVSRTGIKQRHIAADDESSTDLAFHAARAALQNANLNARDIDLIIVATSTPEHVFPSNASQLQYMLGCNSIAAFDVQAVCAGFCYALSVADAFIRAQQARCALVVGAEVFSRILDWQDRSSAILFGDGAGAVILTASQQPGIHASVLHSDGKHRKLLWVPKGVGSSPNETLSPYLSMQGKEVYKFAVKVLAEVVNELLQKSALTIEDVDYLIPHQANSRIIKSTAEQLNLPLEKVIMTVDRHANTSAASIPLALDYALKNNMIMRGQRVILEAFGGGFTWGGSIITY